MKDQSSLLRKNVLDMARYKDNPAKDAGYLYTGKGTQAEVITIMRRHKSRMESFRNERKQLL